MENRDYKAHEDHMQPQYLEEWAGEEDEATVILTSCKYLSRRFLHSTNSYSYTCHSDVDFDGCPKTANEGIADIACFNSPFSFDAGEDNNDDGE